MCSDGIPLKGSLVAMGSRGHFRGHRTRAGTWKWERDKDCWSQVEGSGRTCIAPEPWQGYGWGPKWGFSDGPWRSSSPPCEGFSQTQHLGKVHAVGGCAGFGRARVHFFTVAREGICFGFVLNTALII